MPETLTPRGGPATTRLAHEFGLHEYVWPKLLGHERWKWERMVALIDKAARSQHARTCPGTMADGRTRATPERYAGDHAESHRSSIRLAWCDLLNAGIPSWLTEREDRPERGQDQAILSGSQDGHR